MKKRGQVTLYLVIVAIIVVFLLILFFSNKGPTVEPANDVPEDLRPVTTFIDDCIKVNVEDALTIAMEHGGYIYFEGVKTNPLEQTEAEALEFVPNSGYYIPYWYYMKSDNDCMGACEFSSMRKPLCKTGSGCISEGGSSIEEEIERYIDENVESCFMDFRSFESQGYSITHASPPKSTVSIRQDSVLVQLEYPINIEYNGKSDVFDTFSISVPSFITYFYEAASDIQEYAANNCFVEGHMINVISLYAGLGKDLPPFSASTSDIGDVIWIKPKVEEKVNMLASSYIPLIRVGNTSTMPYPEVDISRYKTLEQGISDQFTFYPLHRFMDVDARFYYMPWWNTYFDVTPPEDGMVIGPSEVIEDSGNFLTSLMGPIVDKEYEFYYEYSFPVTAELRRFDDTGKLRMFRFALESNIRSNKCFHPGVDITSPMAVAPSLLCDKNFFGDKNYTFTIKDEFTKEVLDQAMVSYYAGDTCSLGSTDSQGKFITNIPTAEGGFLKFEKFGYLSKYVHEKDMNSQMIILLKPLIEKNVSLNIFNMTTLEAMSASQSPLSVRDSGLRQPHENETIIVMVDRIKESYQDPDYNQMVAFSDNKTTPSTIKLPTGKYTVSINLFYMGNVNISEEKDRICEAQIAGILGSCVKTPVDDACSPRGNPDDLEGDFRSSNCYVEGYTCETISEAISKKSDFVKWNQYTECMGVLPGIHCTVKWCAADEEILLPEMNMSSIPNGGALINMTNGYWGIFDYERLNASSNVNFYILQQDLPHRHHELEDLMMFEQISMDMPSAFKPRLVE